MSNAILQLSAVSIVCGVVLSLLPEGGCKKIGQILCTAALMSCILSPIMEFDFEAYALESAKLHEMEAAFSKDAAETEDRLNRTVIHREYREYILDKAAELGLDEIDVLVHTNWNEENLWVPFSVEINGKWDEAQMQKLKQIIRDELGVPEERQYWERG